MKKNVSSFFTILCLLSTVFLIGLASNIQPVRAIGTIYIRADGSVDPPDAPIHRDGDLYTLTDNITCDADGIVIDRNDTTLNGAGYTLRGSYATGSRGIDLSERSNVTIKNANIKSFFYGVYLVSSSSCTVSGNNITASRQHGIGLRYGRYGSSNNNTISGNNIENNRNGIWVDGSYNNVSGNNITASRVDGIVLGWSYNDISGNNIENNRNGIYVDGSYHNVSGNNITANNRHGIRLQGASNNNVSGNNITDNSDIGIYLDDSRSNSIFGNYIADNGWGISLSFSSKDNLVYHNSFINNTKQVVSYDPENTWDDGYPSGGNYWSDYEERYPDAEQIDEAGIWNAPYVIDENSQDNYPLINPWSPPQVEDEVPFWMQWWFYAIVAIIIVVSAGAIYLKKRKPTTPLPPSESVKQSE